MKYVIVETIIQRFGIDADNDADAVTGVEQGQGALIPGSRQVTRSALAVASTPPPQPAFNTPIPAVPVK